VQCRAYRGDDVVVEWLPACGSGEGRQHVLLHRIQPERVGHMGKCATPVCEPRSLMELHGRATGRGAGRRSSGALSPTLMFAAAARVLAIEARAMGCDVPSFRSPPRLLGAQRTIRRTPHGAVVSVAVRGRPFAAVLADMVEGVVRANSLHSPRSDRLRSELWSVLVRQRFVDTDSVDVPVAAVALDGSRRYRPVA